MKKLLERWRPLRTLLRRRRLGGVVTPPSPVLDGTLKGRAGERTRDPGLRSGRAQMESPETAGNSNEWVNVGRLTANFGTSGLLRQPARRPGHTGRQGHHRRRRRKLKMFFVGTVARVATRRLSAVRSPKRKGWHALLSMSGRLQLSTKWLLRPLLLLLSLRSF